MPPPHSSTPPTRASHVPLSPSSGSRQGSQIPRRRRRPSPSPLAGRLLASPRVAPAPVHAPPPIWIGARPGANRRRRSRFTGPRPRPRAQSPLPRRRPSPCRPRPRQDAPTTPPHARFHPRASARRHRRRPPHGSPPSPLPKPYGPRELSLSSSSPPAGCLSPCPTALKAVAFLPALRLDRRPTCAPATLRWLSSAPRRAVLATLHHPPLPPTGAPSPAGRPGAHRRLAASCAPRPSGIRRSGDTRRPRPCP